MGRSFGYMNMERNIYPGSAETRTAHGLVRDGNYRRAPRDRRDGKNEFSQLIWSLRTVK